MTKILIVDASDTDRRSLCSALKDVGHTVNATGTGSAALKMLRADQYDLLVSAATLPDMSGRNILHTLRHSKDLASVRILIVSDSLDVNEMASLLENGADDYLAKYCAPEELFARVNAVLRRPAALALDDCITIGPISLTKNIHQVCINTQEIRFSPVEFRLMLFFMEHPGRVYNRQELLEKVWHQQPDEICERTVDVHVRRIRALLEPYNCEHLLKTVRSFGYRFG